MCQTNVTEDEIYYIIDCIKYKHLTDKYCIINDCNKSRVLQFRHIMEDKDPMVLNNLIQYITDAFKLRESELAMPK